MPLSDARRLAGQALVRALRESRATTLARVMDVDDSAWRMPQQRGVNPVAWELGHLAWFAEFWILRGPHALGPGGLVTAAQPGRIAGADAIFDSSRLDHAGRWQAPLPTREALVAMLGEQLEACIAAIPASADDDAAHYFHRLALFHEDMHGEAFAWMRAALGWPAPAGLEAMARLVADAPLRIEGGAIEIGRRRAAAGFSFDNEEPAAALQIAPFEIDSGPLSAGKFLRFVEAGGYADGSLWPGPAGTWRAGRSVDHPGRWRRAPSGDWEVRCFDRWTMLDAEAPVVHVNAWEAEAYCRWAGRRLPGAAEWECAAQQPRFRWGRSVWEWTASAFEPYPGFVAGPYRDYSKPWFGDHRELRGGSFVTEARMHHPSYRNFFTPERSDIFSGFRTAALLSD
jgi:iron(II)-dependent oxidoreductase